MSEVEVLFFKDEKGCPVREWLDSIDKRAKAKGIVRIERLAVIIYEKENKKNKKNI